MRALLLPIVLFAAGVAVAGQQGQSSSGASPADISTPGTGAISGVLSDSATGRPLAGAVVYLGLRGLGPVGQVSRQITDAHGRFVFLDLVPSDVYFLNGSKFGYTTGNYMEHAGLLSLAAGQWISNANFTLSRLGAISGAVIDEHGEPIVGAYVRVIAQVMVAGTPQLARGFVATTDDLGEYRIAGLLPGHYIVSVPSVQSSVPMASTTSDIEGQTPEALARFAATAASGRTTVPLRNKGALEAGSDALLIIGSYVTPPAPIDRRPQTYPPMYFPSAMAISGAKAIEVAAGDDRQGIDIALQPVPAFRVSGRVDAPPDALRSLVLRLMPAGLEDLGNAGETATALVGADGRFTFLNVPSGSYAIEARQSALEFTYAPPLAMSGLTLPAVPGYAQSSISVGSLVAAPSGTQYAASMSRGSDAYWARMPITVGAADAENIVVSMNHTVSVHGKFVFEQTGTTPPPHERVFLEPADGSPSLGMPSTPPGAQVDPSEPFTVTGLLLGEYTFRFSYSPAFTVKSITVNGQDFTHKPIDTSGGHDIDEVVITFTDKLIKLTGNVTDAHGAPPSRATVLAFPVEREQWSHYGLTPARIQTEGVERSGAYSFNSLPAGDYYVIAVDASVAAKWRDPAFLEAASKLATRISADWGQPASYNLQVSPIK